MRALTTAICVALATAAAPFARAQDGGFLDIRYGETASPLQSIFALPVIVAERERLFVRHGLHFSIVPVQGGGEATVDVLTEGRADISHVATNFLITAALKGSDAVAVASEFNNPIYSLVAKPWIKGFADLKGRQVGMADMTGTVSLSTLALMKKRGLARDDVRIKVVEGTPSRFACLLKEDCAAAPLGQPQDFFAKRQGFNILGLSSEAVPDFVYTVTIARKSWAEKNPEAVTRYVAALADAFRFIRDPANRDSVARTIQDAWGSSDSSARETLALYFEPERNVLPLAGEISLKGVRQVIDFMDEAGAFKAGKPAAERFVDARWLRAAGVAERD
jgi:NitT/TauT family transport system substrate-binding protein